MNRANLIRESVERFPSALSASRHTKFVMIPGGDWEGQEMAIRMRKMPIRASPVPISWSLRPSRLRVGGKVVKRVKFTKLT